MAAFNKFNQFVGDVATKVHNLNSDVLKIALTDSAPVATNTVLANITQIAAANGYSSGGATATFVSGPPERKNLGPAASLWLAR